MAKFVEAHQSEDEALAGLLRRLAASEVGLKEGDRSQLVKAAHRLMVLSEEHGEQRVQMGMSGGLPTDKDAVIEFLGGHYKAMREAGDAEFWLSSGDLVKAFNRFSGANRPGETLPIGLNLKAA